MGKPFAEVAQSYCQPPEADGNFLFVIAEVRCLIQQRAKERTV
jgi:hypothetical protein